MGRYYKNSSIDGSVVPSRSHAQDKTENNKIKPLSDVCWVMQCRNWCARALSDDNSQCIRRNTAKPQIHTKTASLLLLLSISFSNRLTIHILFFSLNYVSCIWNVKCINSYKYMWRLKSEEKNNGRVVVRWWSILLISFSSLYETTLWNDFIKRSV